MYVKEVAWSLGEEGMNFFFFFNNTVALGNRYMSGWGGGGNS